MSKTMHMALSVRGALLWNAGSLRGMFRHDDGRMMTPIEVRAELVQALSEGKELLPFGAACEGFSYTTGCPGHATPIPDSRRDSA